MSADAPMAGPAAKAPVPVICPYRLRVRELEGQARNLRAALVCSFNQLLGLRDLNAGTHSTRLAEWGLRVAREIGVAESCLPDLEMGALLHDIGKVGIPDSILAKPGRLTDKEFEIVKRHSEFGWTVIRNLPGLEHTSLQVLHHHENFDGTGYPAGLKGSETPIGARIVSVIDAFDAMISSRPYRAGLPLDEAIRRLEAASGTQFDPVVVQTFVRIARAEMPALLGAVGLSVRPATFNHQ
jgi:HD-GYP domain-containing protein (c-di-GMP phosphodiesterase class II)